MEKTDPRKSYLKYLPALILTLLGAVGGYLYYRLVGCAGGACPITSNPIVSTLYGAVIGFLLGTIVTPDRKK
jgi:uncharacterized YccA/Bax inhibitor family protein